MAEKVKRHMAGTLPSYFDLAAPQLSARSIKLARRQHTVTLRRIAQTVERSAKEVRLATDAGKLQKLLTCLDRERGREFCSDLLSTLRTCFSPVHRRRLELAKDKALE